MHQVARVAHHACSVLPWIYAMPAVVVAVLVRHLALLPMPDKAALPWAMTVAATAVVSDKPAAMQGLAVAAALAAIPAMAAMAGRLTLHPLLVAAVAAVGATKTLPVATAVVASGYKVKVQAALQDLPASVVVVVPAERLAPMQAVSTAVAVAA